MAKTYFNYQPRDPQAQINWAEAASNLGNVIKEEARVREEKKAAIDEATRNFQKELGKGVPGESTSIREWGLNYAGEAQNQMDMLTTMLKSGQMSVAEYTKNKQNLVDGTEEAFSLMEDYQKEYAVKMERLQSEDPANASQRLEAWVMENVEGFGNFNKTQLTIDPDTGKVMAAKKVKNEETGLMELSTDPNDIVPVSALKNNIISKFNKYDVEKNTKQWTDNLGTFQTVARTVGDRRKAGEILTVVGKIPAQYDNEGKRIMNKVTPEMAKEYGLDKNAVSALNDYIEAEDSWIDGQLSNPYNMTSLMTDYVNSLDGKEISFTFNQDEAKENPNLILMKRDEGGTPVPVFDESINPNAAKQKEEIRQYMKYAIRTKVGETSSIQTYNDYKAPQQWQYQVGENKKQIQNTVSIWNEMGWADADRKNVLANAFIGTPQAQAAGLNSIVFNETDNTVKFIYEDTGKNITKPMPTNQSDWSKIGTEIHGQQGKIAEFGNEGNKFVSSGFNKVKAKREGRTNPNQEVNAMVDRTTLKSKETKDVIDFATKVGGTIKRDGSKIEIVNANDQPLDIKDATIQAIKNHMKQVTAEQAQGMINRKQTGGGKIEIESKTGGTVR